MSTDGIGVLVGLDESACADEALRWAAADAVARRVPLTVATVVDLPRLADVPVSSQLLAAAQQAGRRTVDAGVQRAGQLAPGVVAHGHVATGNPVVELLRMAAGAQQVVVGSHGLGEFRALLIGSVGGQVAEHAPGPAVVVRRRPAGSPVTGGPVTGGTVTGGTVVGGTVVVGIDDSEHSEAALEYGFAYADRHGLPLLALHAYVGAFAYPVMSYPSPSYPTAEEEARVRAEAVRSAGDSLGRWTQKYPDVDARSEVAEGSAAHALVEASRNASLLVVGTRGHGGLAGMLLGSVSHAVMRHAHCPVVIAR